MARQSSGWAPGAATLAHVDAADVRAYVSRCWAAVGALKREYWTREFTSRGAVATFEASQALWVHMRAVRPDWPSNDEREADLAHHLALKRLIDRATRALAVRPGH